MKLFHKRNKLSGGEAKKFYQQLTKYGIAEKNAQKTVQLYEE